MKLILSRKGFDSGSGGGPSPTLPDGRLITLPIPDPGSTIQYGDLAWDEINVGDLVADLTRGKVRHEDGAHLDPDLNADSLPRLEGWRPLFGQCDAAQGHLQNQGVGPGDLFVFFGLFRDAELTTHGYRWVPGSTPRHIIWGWLQVGSVIALKARGQVIPPWAAYHPHVDRQEPYAAANDTVYVASHTFTPDRTTTRFPGAGLFRCFRPGLQLTAPDAAGVSDWQVPGWMAPAGRPPLSFHASPARWTVAGRHTRLRAVSRGQEFVLDTAHYPEALPWFTDLLDGDDQSLRLTAATRI